MDIHILLPGGIVGLTLLGAFTYAWRRSVYAGYEGQNRGRAVVEALEVVGPPALTVVVAVMLAVGLFALGVFVFFGSLNLDSAGFIYVSFGLAILAGLVLLGGVGIGVYWAVKRIRRS